jgi:hypothetical protein
MIIPDSNGVKSILKITTINHSFSHFFNRSPASLTYANPKQVQPKLAPQLVPDARIKSNAGSQKTPHIQRAALRCAI